jgi:hypothetical protein
LTVVERLLKDPRVDLADNDVMERCLENAVTGNHFSLDGGSSETSRITDTRGEGWSQSITDYDFSSGDNCFTRD